MTFNFPQPLKEFSSIKWDLNTLYCSHKPTVMTLRHGKFADWYDAKYRVY